MDGSRYSDGLLRPDAAALLLRKRLVVLAQSILIYFGAGLAVYLLEEAASATAPLWVYLARMPPDLVLATLPIRFGGWGPREAMLFGFLGYR